MRIIVLALLLGGCGSAYQMGQTGKSKSSPAPATSPSPGPGSGDATEKPAGDGVPDAMTVADESKLPACDAGHEGWLMYVMATKTFETCMSGKWTVIDLTGPKGDQGPAGASGANGAAGGGPDDPAAFALYEKYRKSVFRVTTVCKPKTPYPATCPANPTNPTVFLGSAFLCEPGTACTNIHVLACVPTTCYDFVSLSLQATKGDTDTLNPDTTQAAPFFTTTSNASFKLHPSYDVAKFPITNVPSAAAVTPITDKPANGNLPDMTPILSMSFPLGFQDMYTLTGQVITPFIGECDTQGGVSGYGCPKQLYSFAVSNQTDHGSSGSPLFDVDTGLVVGITSAGTDGANADYTWATDAFHITEIK